MDGTTVIVFYLVALGLFHCLQLMNSVPHPVNTVLRIHQEDSRIAQESKHSLYPQFLNESFTVFTTNSLPNSRLLPTIGNGHLATVVGSDTIYVNGVYNGRAGDSHRARVPSTAAVSIGNLSTDSYASTYTLDVGRGIYREKHEHPSGLHVISTKLYAHQLLNHVIVTEIQIENKDFNSFALNLTENMGPQSEDIDFKKDNSTLNARFFTGGIKVTEYPSSERVQVYHLATKVPPSITVPPLSSHRFLFLTAVGTSKMKTSYQFIAAVDMFFNDTLESSHVDLWLDKWRNGRIDLHGNTEQSRVTYAALYYVMSSLPTASAGEHFYGLSPGGLAHGAANKDYEGHIFWDQDTWMFPPIMLLQPEMGEAMLEARIGQLPGAREYAKSRNYSGAMFPWETAFTGLDVCPGPIYSAHEQHVTGDVALALRQYMMVTRNKDFLLKKDGASLALDIAEFWKSRLELNSTTGLYEIHYIMPPDEYHSTVNNSVYTNTIAQISLRVPSFVLPFIGKKPPEEYEEMAKKIYIPFNATGQWHPEFDGYTEGTVVKQADVVLLGFPLMVNMTAQVRENDLNIYEKHVTPGGPAMTWGMFSIGWLELGQKQKADDLFQKQMLNVNEPFKVWSEVPEGGGAVNFLTGMGGYLQSLLFGYAGFRMYEDRLEFNPTLPPGTYNFNISGVNYRGASLDFSFSTKWMSINQTKRNDDGIKIVIVKTGQAQTLDVGNPVLYHPEKAYLTGEAIPP